MRSEALTLEAAGRMLGFDGHPVTVEFPFGSVCTFVTVDQHEVASRRQHQIDPITDLGALIALNETPHGFVMPWSAFDTTTRGLVEQVPEALIRVTDDAVERVVARPVRVTGAVAAGGWAEASRHVSPLATLCSVGVVTSENPHQAGSPSIEAVLYGIGLIYTSTHGAPHLVHEPSPSPRLPGPYEWWLCEVVYAALLDGDGSLASGALPDTR